jgi:hypothetical protein
MLGINPGESIRTSEAEKWAIIYSKNDRIHGPYDLHEYSASETAIQVSAVGRGWMAGVMHPDSEDAGRGFKGNLLLFRLVGLHS